VSFTKIKLDVFCHQDWQQTVHHCWCCSRSVDGAVTGVLSYTDGEGTTRLHTVGNWLPVENWKIWVL